MGEFLVQFGGRRLVLPNTCHAEGAQVLWNRALDNGDDDLAFELGLCVGLPAVSGVLADVSGANEGGCKDAYLAPASAYPDGDNVHRNLMGYARQNAVVSVSRDGGTVIVSTAEKTFDNNAIWGPVGFASGALAYWKVDWYIGRVAASTVSAQRKDAFAGMIHGFPWATPNWAPGLVGFEFEVIGVIDDDPDAGPPERKWVVDCAGMSWTPHQWVGYDFWVEGKHSVVIDNDSNSLDITAGITASDGVSVTGYLRQGNADFIHVDTPSDPDDHTQFPYALDEDAWNAVSLPIAGVFLACKDNSITPDPGLAALVASAKFVTPIYLAPGAGMTVAYRGALREFNSVLDA